MGAWNNIPTLSAGITPTDAELAIITGFLANALEFAFVFKASDQTITSSTTMTNDSDLLYPMAIGGNYAAIGKIGYAGVAASVGNGQVKVGWTVPAGAAFKWQSNALDSTVSGNSGITDHTDRTASTPTLGCNGVSSPNAFTPVLHVINSGTAGNLQFQWAQASSSATGSIVKNGSWLIVVRFA